jgi:hypothetical protein
VQNTLGLALVLVVAGACGGDDGAGPADDAGLDTEAVEDGAADTAADADADAPDDAAADGVPDAEPGPGELGGPCAPGGTCTAGACESLPAGERCTVGCLSNYECPDGLRCEAVTPESMYCLYGPRGDGRLGEPCGVGLQGLGCRSGLCVDADPEQAIPVDTCTEPCEDDGGCAVPFPVCFSMIGLCLPILSGDLGGLCTSTGSCTDGTCLDVPGLGERCTRTCAAGASCGPDYLECRDAGGTSYCLMRESGGG